MKQEWIVQVADPSGVAISEAKVALFAFDPKKHAQYPFSDVPATHAHHVGGRYEEEAAIAAADGSWHLVVLAQDKSPVVQPLTLKKLPSGEFEVSPDDQFARTVVRHLERLTDKKTIVVVRNVFQVTMHPASEVVSIAGIDYDADVANPHTHQYPPGTNFDLYAETRRDQLWNEKRLNDGTVITHFSCRSVSHSTFVRAFGNKWLRVFHSVLDEARANLRAKRPNAERESGDVSITHLYTYLSSVGARNSFSVREVSIFSHSFSGGPILYNTGDSTRRPEGKRDPEDFDARPKDFLPANTDSWPKLVDAIQVAARWYIWGCRASVHMQQIAQESRSRLRAKAPRGTFFVVKSVFKPHHRPDIEERYEESLNLTIAKWKFEEEILSGYPAAVVKLLDIDVWAAPPGVGASLVKRKTRQAMQVENSPAVKEYLRREFKGVYVENGDGYVNYRKLASLKPSPMPRLSSEYYFLTRVRRDKETTTLESWNGRRRRLSGFNFTHTTRRVESLVTRGIGGVLHILEESSTRGFAVYIQDDGGAFHVYKDPQGHFTIPGPPI